MLVVDQELLLHDLAATADHVKFGPRVVAVDGTGDQQLYKALAAHFELCQFVFGGRASCAVLYSDPVGFFHELVAELIEQFIVPETLLHRTQDARFDFIAPNRQMVGADTPVARAAARKPRLRIHREAETAQATVRQAREQIYGTTCDAYVPCRT